MNQYKIFRHPTGAAEAVKQGWSWPASIFDLWWAIVKGMWGIAFTLIGVAFGIGLFAAAAGGDQAISFLQIAFTLISKIVFGLNGNEWRENRLAARGYKAVGIVSAKSVDDALALQVGTGHAEARA